MIQKTEFRWGPDKLATMPLTQLIAIFCPPINVVNEVDAIKRVNEIRASKGWPPLKRLVGKG